MRFGKIDSRQVGEGEVGGSGREEIPCANKDPGYDRLYSRLSVRRQIRSGMHMVDVPRRKCALHASYLNTTTDYRPATALVGGALSTNPFD